MKAVARVPATIPMLEPLEPRLLLDGENPILAQVDYLIITADCFLQGENPKVIELADWKQSKGFRTKTVSMSYIESYADFYSLPITDAIRNYIACGWSKPGEEYWDTPPKYVLLVGGDDGDGNVEEGEVPAASGQQLMHPTLFHVTDNPYGILDGEYYSSLDVAIGRIPLSTVDDVTMAINKILTYDRTPDVPGPEEVNWYNNALVAATYMGRTTVDEYNVTHAYETGGYFMETAHRVADFIGPAIPDYDFWNDEAEPHEQLNPDYHVGYNVYTALALDPGAEPNLELNADWFYHYNNGGGWRDAEIPFPGRGPFPDPIPGVCGTSGWLGQWTSRSLAGQRTVAAFNEGLGLVLYRDHGAVDGWTFGLGQSTLLGRNDLLEPNSVITNHTATPVVFSIGCLTGQFSDTNCFAAELLRTQGAAVGVIAATDETRPGDTDCLTNGLFTGIPWAPDVAFDKAYQDLFNEYCYYHPGFQAPEPSMRPAEALVFADFYAKANYTCTPNDFQWFGDPEMMLRTQAPRPLSVTADSGYGFSVCVHYPDTGEALQEGRVCISMADDPGIPGNQSKWWAADTNQYGQAWFNVSPDDVRGCNLVVTAFNALPFEAIMVTGTTDNDTVTLAYNSQTQKGVFNIINNNNAQFQCAVGLGADQPQVLLCTLSGQDTVTVDFSAGNPIPAAGIVFDGGEATDSLSVDAASSTSAIEITCVNVESIDATMGAGDDILTVDFSGGITVPTGTMTYDGGDGTDILKIIGTSGDDVLNYSTGDAVLNPDGINATLNFTGVEKHDVQLRAGSDILTVDFSGGITVPTGTMAYDGGDGGDGTDILKIIGTSGDDVLNYSTGEAVLNPDGISATLNFTHVEKHRVDLDGGSDTLNITAGTFTFDSVVMGASTDSDNDTINVTGGSLTAGAVTANAFNLNDGSASIASLTGSGVAPSASVAVGRTMSVGGGMKGLNSLTVNGTLRTSQTTRSTIDTASLTIGANGQLDLNDGLLAVNYEEGDSPLAAITAWVISGYNGLGYDGFGIASSAAALDPTVVGVGYGEHASLILAEPFGPGHPFGDSWNIDDTTVLVRYTLIGDINLDGIVDDIDVTILTNNYLLPGPWDWANGDVFAYDGIVDDLDVGIQANNYLMTA
jgi:hypothetical protein